MEHVGWGLHKINVVFRDFSAVVFASPSSSRRRRRGADYVGDGHEWMKLHGMRDVNGLVCLDWPKFDNLFHDLAAVAIVTSPPSAICGKRTRINNCMIRGLYS